MKSRKLLIILGAIVATIAIVCGLTFVINRVNSAKYNLQEVSKENIPTPVQKVEDGFVTLSQISMHYEKYGETGKALILLHGNGGSCDTLRELATYLGNHYQVYLIESRCHGQSSETETISYEAMAQDVYEFIQAKELEQPYFVGHSDGGMVGLALASLYPDSIEALVSCGSNSNPNMFKPYFTAFVKICDFFEPSKLNKLMLEQPNYTKEFLANIKCKTLIMAAEHDIMTLEDSVFIHDAINNSKLIIVKNADHCSYIENDARQAYNIIKEFLK